MSVPLNLRKFPFDKQLVDITFRSTNWSNFDLVLIDETEEQTLRDTKKKTESKLLEWTVDSEMSITKVLSLTQQNETQESFYKSEESRSYDELKLKFETKRLVQYYAVKIIAVVLLLVIMSWVLFFFDSSDISGRSSTAITIFLAAVKFLFK